MTEMTSPDLVLMLLADGRLPTSGHTQSGGLEPALAHGLRREEIPDYCRARLRTIARVDAGAAVVARNHVLTGRPLLEVEDAWAARTPSDALRRSSYALGRGYRRLASRVWPGATEALSPLSDVSRPTVLGTIAAVSGLDADGLVRLVGFDDVQTVVSAALKLTPFDPAVATQWVHGLSEDIEALVAPLRGLTHPADVPACSAPLIEAWAQAHDRSTRRLFNA